MLYVASAYVISSTGDVIAIRGSTVVLEVTAFGIPQSITYEWRKNGVVLTREVSNILTIDNVGFLDVGSYECIPSNVHGTHNSSVIQLSVESDGEWLFV